MRRYLPKGVVNQQISLLSFYTRCRKISVFRVRNVVADHSRSKKKNNKKYIGAPLPKYYTTQGLNFASCFLQIKAMNVSVYFYLWLGYSYKIIIQKRLLERIASSWSK
jgi:hypothetical protein